MSLITKYGHGYLFRAAYRQEGQAEFWLVLCTDADAPTEDTEDLSELTEIDEGNGYAAGGIHLDADDVDFALLDVSGGYTRIGLRTILLEATGGDIPASGDPIKYAVLRDADNKVHVAWTFASTQTVPSGQQRQITDLLARLSPPA